MYQHSRVINSIRMRRCMPMRLTVQWSIRQRKGVPWKRESGCVLGTDILNIVVRHDGWRSRAISDPQRVHVGRQQMALESRRVERAGPCLLIMVMAAEIEISWDRNDSRHLRPAFRSSTRSRGYGSLDILRWCTSPWTLSSCGQVRHMSYQSASDQKSLVCTRVSGWIL
jgi:hypothetical protein